MVFNESFVEQLVGGPVDPAIYNLLAEASLIVPLESGGRWRFGHPLVHDAAYTGLLASRRREIHTRVADRLEANGRRGAIGVLARHRAAAGDPRAVPLLIEAAEEALAVGAAAEAAQFWTAAADLLGSDPAAAACRERARSALDVVPVG
jgi:predicted ATPase